MESIFWIKRKGAVESVRKGQKMGVVRNVIRRRECARSVKKDIAFSIKFHSARKNVVFWSIGAEEKKIAASHAILSMKVVLSALI